jgi:ubiquitin C
LLKKRSAESPTPFLSTLWIFVMSQIQAQTAGGKTFTITGKPSETVGQALARMRDKEGLGPDEERLFFNGVELENHFSIEHYMKTAAPPMAAPPQSAEIQIFVKSITGKTMTLKTKSTDTVAQVKAQLQTSEGIAPDDQILTYGGKTLDQPGLTLADYDIGEGRSLDLRIRIKGGHR